MQTVQGQTALPVTVSPSVGDLSKRIRCLCETVFGIEVEAAAAEAEGALVSFHALPSFSLSSLPVVRCLFSRSFAQLMEISESSLPRCARPRL